jgi:hypothetical protein
LSVQTNPEGGSAEGMHQLRQAQKEKVLAYLEREIENARRREVECETREAAEEQARQAAEVLPPREVLERIMRYESRLERQLYRAMAQLERVQRMRLGDTVPAPVAVVVA